MDLQLTNKKALVTGWDRLITGEHLYDFGPCIENLREWSFVNLSLH
jgi:hypothetical protein